LLFGGDPFVLTVDYEDPLHGVRQVTAPGRPVINVRRWLPRP